MSSKPENFNTLYIIEKMIKETGDKEPVRFTNDFDEYMIHYNSAIESGKSVFVSKDNNIKVYVTNNYIVTLRKKPITPEFILSL